MNILIALCMTALCRAAPLSSRTVDTHRKAASHEAERRASLEAERHSSRDNIAELLIPLLEQTLDDEHDGKHKKVIQVLPYEGSEERENKGWRKLKSNKKQLVEITPVRRRVGNNKHLAYILSSAKPVENLKESVTSEENTFEDSVELDDENSQSVDDKHRGESSEHKVSSEIDSDSSDKIDNTDKTHDEDDTKPLNTSSDEDLLSVEPENDESKDINLTISDETVSVETSGENGELQQVVEDSSKDTEESVDVDSHDLQFGPGNNILFERGSSESAAHDDSGDVDKDVNRSGDDDDELISAASGEAIGEKEGAAEPASEHQAAAQEPSARYGAADSSSRSRDLDVEQDFTVDRNTYGFDERSIDNPKNSRSKEVIEVLQSGEDKGTGYNCDKIARGGEPRRRSREHKSYRLSFLFNK